MRCEKSKYVDATSIDKQEANQQTDRQTNILDYPLMFVCDLIGNQKALAESYKAVHNKLMNLASLRVISELMEMSYYQQHFQYVWLYNIIKIKSTTIRQLFPYLDNGHEEDMQFNGFET